MPLGILGIDGSDTAPKEEHRVPGRLALGGFGDLEVGREVRLRPLNCGAFRQRLAAFRDWKLIAGRGDSLAMTDVARMIALSTDDAAERQALQMAFVNCPVFFKLYDQSAKGQPLAAGPLGRKAVHDLGIAAGSKDKFVQSFTESAIAAGLAERTDDDQLVLLPLESAESGGGEPPAPSQLVGARVEAGSAAIRPGSSQRPSALPVIHQAWDIAGGTITFEVRTAEPLPATAFATIGDVVASLERLAATLAPAPAVDTSGDDPED